MSRVGIGILSILSFSTVLYFSLQNSYFRTGYTDFKVFYAGARLAGSPQLYDSQKIRETFYEATGSRLPDWANHIAFTRMPWVAAALWPLGKLSYAAAFWTWQVILTLSFVAFLAVCPHKQVWPFAGLSLPLIHSWAVGQDSALLLLLVALALRCCSSGWHFTAGLLLSLGACNKPHLFVLLPLMLWSLRLPSIFKGLVLGGAVLTGISFWIMGATWPLSYYRGVLTNPAIDTWKGSMTSFASAPAGLIPWLTVLTIGLVWWALRQTTVIDQGLGLVVVGSLLIAPHSYIYDHTLLLVALPPFLTLGPTLRFFTAFMLLPVIYLVFTARASPLPAGVPLLLLAWLAVAAWHLHALRIRSQHDSLGPPEIARPNLSGSF
jgi:hypothetical protein